ncbi:metallophosphoesterase [Methanogenium marinum]|uniref:Metallophosphoesterase n=1 Tax=Methanogenium marinum TaxID=348610 RepID=A0A9Q4KUU4_9EURY|nr:metallophosphoesterase [Methanogenium marinum]MDE4907725.1 metallophosphoesterase [Methanogenium marinum]
MQKTLKILIILLMIPVIFQPCMGFGDLNITSPINGKILEFDEKTNGYSFLVIGHAYGAPYSPSVYPSSSLLAKIDLINQNNASFIVLTGDNFRNADNTNIENFIGSFSSKINIPIFNSAGNHDLTNRSLYEKYFGITYYRFCYGSDYYIILDSEKNHGEIIGDQLEFLRNSLNEISGSDNVNNVFIFSHKLIWTVKNPEFQIVYNNLNSQGGYANSDNFISCLKPELVNISENKQIYLISGDIGRKQSYPIFYHKDDNITYIATGLGDTINDAILKFTVLQDGKVNVQPISLTGNDLSNIDTFGIEFWENHFLDISNTETISARILRIINNLYFKLGILFTICILGVFFIFIWRYRKL